MLESAVSALPSDWFSSFAKGNLQLGSQVATGKVKLERVSVDFVFRISQITMLKSHRRTETE